MPIGNIDDLLDVKLGTLDEPLSVARSLSDFADISTLLVHHEVLPPGRAASKPHTHTEKEEITLVLSGHPSLWLDGEVTALKPGDFIGFNKLEPRPHMLINASDEDAVILTIGTNPPNDLTHFVDLEAY